MVWKGGLKKKEKKKKEKRKDKKSWSRGQMRERVEKEEKVTRLVPGED